MCVWQTFQSNPNHAYAAHHHQPSYFHHLPFTIHDKKTKPQPQNKTTLRTQCVCVMRYLCAMCYVLCVMCQPQWSDPNSIRLRFKYQLNRTIWLQQKKKFSNIERLPNNIFFPLYLATVYNDTAHLMGSL